jgi:hypothetical protein
MQQVFISHIPHSRAASFLFEPSTTIEQIKDEVCSRFPFLENCEFVLRTNQGAANSTKTLKEFQNDILFPIFLSFHIGCLGGKGGFGTVLKSQGKRLAQKKTTNFESCRDLTGRRLKTINEAKQYWLILCRLADYIEQEPERLRKQQEKLQKKIKEGLKEHTVVKKKHNDKDFDSHHEKVLELLDEAVGAGLKKAEPVIIASSSKKQKSVWKDSDDDSD